LQAGRRGTGNTLTGMDLTDKLAMYWWREPALHGGRTSSHWQRGLGSTHDMKPGDYTDMGGMGAAFLTTHWSLVEQAGSDQALIGSLLERYWKPVYCYLRRKGYGNEDAKDLTQGFFHEIVLGHHLVEKADPSKGRFRAYLLVALDHYLLNVKDKQDAQKRIPHDRLIALDTMDLSELPPAVSGLDAEEFFNYAWVSTLLEEVLEQVENGCRQEGLSTHWQLFCDRVLQPILETTEPPSLAELCGRYGIEDAGKASNMIITIKRRFQTALYRQLRRLVASDEQVREEFEEIRRFFPDFAQENEEPR
jgi:DNA-directed RNA polymerase specialized sigma24 family protein